jgi:CNT family concentrative nucleoside transporter
MASNGQLATTSSVQRKASRSTESFTKEKPDPTDAEAARPEEVDPARAYRQELYRKFRPLILSGVALVILGWWISATILKATRHRWCVRAQHIS